MRLLFIFILLFTATFMNAQSPDCNKIRTGKFMTILEPGSKKQPTIIQRYADRQVEVGEDSLTIESKITWTSGCTYELSNTRVLKGTAPDIKVGQILYVTVLDVKDDSFTAKVTANFSSYNAIFFYRILK
jgi:hypothetical protein